jgi:uncharacterized membrane protein
MEGDARIAGPVTLPDLGLRAISTQAVLLALSAAVLPAVSHLANLPVRWLLPMHWAVLLAGLIYGWRAGMAIGLLAPGASFLLSGMPLPHILPAMTVELAAYGFVAGFARQTWRLGQVASMALAVVTGRVVFVAMALATGAAAPTVSAYLKAALLPGLAAAVVQVLLLPFVAQWWIRRESRK